MRKGTTGTPMVIHRIRVPKKKKPRSKPPGQVAQAFALALDLEQRKKQQPRA